MKIKIFLLITKITERIWENDNKNPAVEFSLAGKPISAENSSLRVTMGIKKKPKSPPVK